MRLILTGDNAGRVVEDWLADEIGADTVDTVEAARIVREGNENASRAQDIRDGAESPRVPNGWVLEFPDPGQNFRYWCRPDREAPSWETTSRECVTTQDLVIVPDPSTPWGEGYKAIMPDEAKYGDEYWNEEDRKWVFIPRSDWRSVGHDGPDWWGCTVAWHRPSSTEANANPVSRPDERDAKIADMGAMIASLRDVLRDAHAQIAPLEAEVARLKRHRLVLTAWMRMFRSALDAWSKTERGQAISIRSIVASWDRTCNHGALWVAEKMGGV
jgi:hypothetical protein